MYCFLSALKGLVGFEEVQEQDCRDAVQDFINSAWRLTSPGYESGAQMTSCALNQCCEIDEFHDIRSGSSGTKRYSVWSKAASGKNSTNIPSGEASFTGP